MKCPIHTEFFDDTCEVCRQEYLEMKGAHDKPEEVKKYKEFTEERAKKLYEDLMLQYLKTGMIPEVEADRKAKAIIRKQCSIRGQPFWDWV